MSQEWTRAHLTEQLRSLGLQAGDGVVVHASLRAIGAVAGGAETVVDALLDTLGPTGLLVVPTFTYDTAYFQGTERGRTGAIAEAARLGPGAVRSAHPSHSVAALGNRAAEFCRDHERRAATAPDTPLDRLAASGGFVLLLGVGHTMNTTIHVGEFRAEAPYLDIPFSPSWPRRHTVMLPAGPPVEVEYTSFPGCSRAFGIVERGLRERDAIRDGYFGRAPMQLVRGAAVIDETIALLSHDSEALLCTDPSCYRCSNARERISFRPAAAAPAEARDSCG